MEEGGDDVRVDVEEEVGDREAELVAKDCIMSSATAENEINDERHSHDCPDSDVPFTYSVCTNSTMALYMACCWSEDMTSGLALDKTV